MKKIFDIIGSHEELVKEKKLERYSIASSSKVSCLDDLAKFGLQFDWHWTQKDKESGYMLKPFVNLKEEKIVQPGDWEYKINKYNFREPWDLESHKKKIGFFGCSFTFGEGIDYHNTFAGIVSQRFNVSSFNFGVGGSSIHRIARTFSAALKVINLDYAIFTLPHWSRQLYCDSRGKMINLIPYWPHATFVEISEQLTKLKEDYYIIQSVSFLSWIHDLASASGTEIILSSWDEELNELCKILYPEITIEKFPNIDDKCARDKMHPGEKSHYAHAEQIIKEILNRSWF